jgi:DNA-binding transcriptional regulator YbjK
LRVVLEQIQSRMSFVFSATTTCKKVLEWMYGHQMALPREYRTIITDAQRAEYLLRNQLKYLKRKTDQPPQVLALLDQIKRLSLQVTDSKQCLTLRPWCRSSDESERFELPVPKRRRLLVKTKDPSFV